MKAILVAVVLIFVAGRETIAQPITAMSWNIRYDNPKDGMNAWPHRKDWVAEIILENKVDIAGFQEVLVGQLEHLQLRLPHLETCGVGRDDGKQAGEFAPIFFRKDRFELMAQSTFWLSQTPDTPGSIGWDANNPRIATWIQLKDRHTAIVFYVLNTHFDNRGAKARTESATLLLKHVRENMANHPIILMGDLNATPHSPPYNILIGRDAQSRPVFLDAYEIAAQKPAGPDSTWNGFQEVVPHQRIDFLFTTKAINVLRVRILTDQRDCRFPSDHLPVVAELEI